MTVPEAEREGKPAMIHASFGEWMVSLTAVALALVTLFMIWVSVKLVKATEMATVATEHIATEAGHNMEHVSMHANTEMKDVAVAAIDADHNN